MEMDCFFGVNASDEKICNNCIYYWHHDGQNGICVRPNPDVENGFEYRKRKFNALPQYIKDMIAQEENWQDDSDEILK